MNGDINNIIKKSINSELTSDQQRELADWLALDSDNREYYEKVKAIFVIDQLRLKKERDITFEREILKRILRKELQRRILKYVAAAVILLSVGFGGYSYLSSFTEEISIVASDLPNDNSEIVIMRNNVAMNEVDGSDFSINKSKKEVVFTDNDSLSNEEITIYVGRGYQYRVVLPDSTKVWLNSESQLSYSHFGSDKREVKLRGEACFEVVKDKSRPFIVNFGKERNVTVLGTFFAIKAYEDESLSKISLVNGRVQVNSKGDSLILTPNKELIINNKSNDSRVSYFDPRRINALISGGLVYYDERLEDIVKDIARRYNRELTIIDSAILGERLTIVLDSVVFEDIINYIKKAGRGVYRVEQVGNKIVFSLP